MPLPPLARSIIATSSLAVAAIASPISNIDDPHHTLHTRDYTSDALPRNWWKVTLITLALVFAIPLLVVALVYACACCCGTPVPRFRLVRLPDVHVEMEKHVSVPRDADEAEVGDDGLGEARRSGRHGAGNGAPERNVRGMGMDLAGGPAMTTPGLPPAPAYTPPEGSSAKWSSGRNEGRGSEEGRKAKEALGISRCVVYNHYLLVWPNGDAGYAAEDGPQEEQGADFTGDLHAAGSNSTCP